MIDRKLEKTILEYLKQFPVVGILGARQVGKTTIAQKIKSDYFSDAVYLDLEYPPDLYKLEEPELFLNEFQDKLVIIDEIQRKPSLFQLIRVLVDRKRTPGRFLILGSASPELFKKTSETLAGRIAFIELSPFSLEEVGSDNWKKLWLCGGFPESFLNSEKNSFLWREFFIKTFIERDIPQLGFKIPSENIRKFWSMIAHCQNQLWNATQIANNLGVSAPTVKNYLLMLKNTYMIRVLYPYHTNVKKRLIKTPKIIIRDSGILHCFFNIKNFKELISHQIVGNSWEGFVVEEILKTVHGKFESFFYRTRAGAEIDLVLTMAGKVEIAIEIKFSLTPKISKGFYNAVEDLQPNKKIIVYPGDLSYKKGDMHILSIKEIDNIKYL